MSSSNNIAAIPIELRSSLTVSLSGWKWKVLSLKDALIRDFTHIKKQPDHSHNDVDGQQRKSIKENINKVRQETFNQLDNVLSGVIAKIDFSPVLNATSIAANRAHINIIQQQQEAFISSAKALLHSLKATYISNSDRFGDSDFKNFQINAQNVFFDKWFKRVKENVKFISDAKELKKTADGKGTLKIIGEAAKVRDTLKADIPSLYTTPNPVTIALFEAQLREAYLALELAKEWCSRPMGAVIAHSLTPLEALLQTHIPKYNSEWDSLITSVAWLLRKGSFWKDSQGSSTLEILYDFVPYENNKSYKVISRVQPISSPTDEEKEIIEVLQAYFEKVLKNVESILNVRFKRGTKLHQLSSDTKRPQLRLIFFKEYTNYGGVASFPGEKDGGDIWIRLKKHATYKKKDLVWLKNGSPNAFFYIKMTIIHELGHALGLSHHHQNVASDCSAAVLGHKISSPPPRTQYEGIGRFNHIYSSFIYTMMCYEEHSWYAKKNVKCLASHGHFGYLDYLALLCVYGPNADGELKGINESYKFGKLSTEDINFKNLEKIKEVIGPRSMDYPIRALKPTLTISAGKNNISPSKSRLMTKGQSVHIVTDTSCFLDGFSKRTLNGFSKRTRVRQFKGKGSDIVLGSETVVYTFQGSNMRDVILFNPNIKESYGNKGSDIYCFYKDNWGRHIIEEKEEINFIVLYETDIDHLKCSRSDKNSQEDLYIYDQRAPNQRIVKINRYFKDSSDTDPDVLSSSPYTILAILDQPLKNGKSYQWKHRNKYVAMLDVIKLRSQLKLGQHQVLKEFFA